jgi:hypothetical protein
MKKKRFLGIFVNPYMVQSEGIRYVFDNLEAVGAAAIALSPQVGRPVVKGEGKRIPILHVDGYKRLLARPAWGKHELYIKFFPVIDTDLRLYSETKYKPYRPSIPPDIDASIPRKMIAEAKKRSMETYLHLQPFIPPNIQPEDQPVYPDGTVPIPPQVAMFGSPGSPDVRMYGKALITECVKSFDNIDGLFIDWTEFGTYRFENLFTCLGLHSENMAGKFGYDWGYLKNTIKTIWKKLHQLQEADLLPAKMAFHSLINEAPGWSQFLRFKSEVIISFYREVRETLNRLNKQHVKLMARGWPPPWSRMSGLWYERLGDVCYAATPKLFAFDYCAIPRWYGETIKRWNPSLPENTIVNALVEWLDLPDNIENRTFKHYVIPAVNDFQPVGVDAYQRRVAEVVTSVDKHLKVQPFAHAHMPDVMWREMIAMLTQQNVDGIWVQMYGYLSDKKLGILREEWHS